MTVSSEESDAELEGTEARINASLEDLRRELKLLQSETTAELRHLASARSMTWTMVALAGFGVAMLIGALAFGGSQFGAEFKMKASAYKKPRSPIALPKKIRKRYKRSFEI